MKLDDIPKLFHNSKSHNLIENSTGTEINHITIDSRSVPENAAFCALNGAATDGHLFYQQAIDNGALLIISEKKIDASVPNIVVPTLADEMNVLIEKLYPLGIQFQGLIGITGTNGKSTIATLIKTIFEQLNEKCGLIGTILFSDGIDQEEATHTTPPYHTILRLLNQASEKKVKHCAVEASSHALSQKRFGNLKMKAAIFTNLTQDHLDYHDDIESYANDKKKLLKHVSENGIVIINSDNDFGKKISDSYKGKLVSTGRKSDATYLISDEKLSIDGCSFNLKYSNQSYAVKTQLIGSYNVDNIVQVLALFIEFGYSVNDLLEIIEKFTGVSGRVEKVAVDLIEGPMVIVDYAHTHDAMDNVLKSVVPLKVNDLWVIFGCGGDRDRKKRSLMGAVSEKYGDQIIITNDNPRTEDPLSIIDEIEKGFESKSFKVIPDRQQAIEYAILNADENDIVMILGKGHEDYQILIDKTIDFDDRMIARAALEKRKAGA